MLTVTNSTISGNSAAYGGTGGGISNFGTLAVTNSTISGNSAPSVGGIFSYVSGSETLVNTIVAGNIGPTRDIGGIIETASPQFYPRRGFLGRDTKWREREYRRCESAAWTFAE